MEFDTEPIAAIVTRLATYDAVWSGAGQPWGILEPIGIRRKMSGFVGKPDKLELTSNKWTFDELQDVNKKSNKPPRVTAFFGCYF